MKKFLILNVLFIFITIPHSYGQVDSCVFPFTKHEMNSHYLKEKREYWVSLPLFYVDSVNYPVIYLFDAEWRFDLIRNIERDLAGNKKIQSHIIVGIPHIEMENKRGIDLTFNHSRIEFDGDKVDSTWFNETNSGGGLNFYNFLKNELITEVDKNYPTNNHRTLIGHSYGGYFGAYILTMPHPFNVIHAYDPSIWYSDGEVTKKLKSHGKNVTPVKVYITYQSIPDFHSNKIEQLIASLKKNNSVEVHFKKFENETHNSLFMESFIEGIKLTNKYISD
jgi:predicted alpha/beta superfamily hydrolase